MADSVSEYAKFFASRPRRCWIRLTRCCSITWLTIWTGRCVRLDADALMADAADIFFGPSKWQRIQVPDEAPDRGVEHRRRVAPRPTPPRRVAAFRDVLDVLVTVRPVPGVDHAASIMTMTGARATADLIAEALAPETLA